MRSDSSVPDARLDSRSTSKDASVDSSTDAGTSGPIPIGPGTTWYVRADGGSRYSTNATMGQCDGKHDAAYSGTGVNQPCAFKDFRFLYDDPSSYNQLTWAIAGGDTVVVRDGPWRIGWDNNTGTGQSWCTGWSSGPYGCLNPMEGNGCNEVSDRAHRLSGDVLL